MSIDFNGTDDSIWENGLAPVTAAPLSMACWFNADVTASMCMMMLARNNSSQKNNFELAVRSDSLISALAKQANSGAEATKGTYSTGTWHHAGARFVSSASRFAYLDGVAGSENTTSKTPASILNTAIGSRVDTGTDGRFFNGQIGEAGIWDVALDDEEFKSLAAGVSPLLVRPNNLVAYWPLNNVNTQRNDITSNDVYLDSGNAGDAGASHPPMIYPSSQILQFPSAAAPPAGASQQYYYYEMLMQGSGL